VDHRPSRTALGVAVGQLLNARDPATAPLMPPGARELLETNVAAFVPRGPRFLRNLERPWFRRLMWRFERLIARGIFLHYLLRKRFIEDAVREALGAGCSQFLVIGAGLDTLATRIARERADVQCIEVDHPATQAIKRAALEKTMPPNLTLVAADLRERRLADVLRESGRFDPSRPSAFVIEGVLMYLPEDAVASLLGQLRDLACAGSLVVFTFMEPDSRGRPRFRGVARWYAPILDYGLKRMGEPMQWAITRDALGRWLAELDWRLLDVGTRESFRTRYLTPVGLGSRELVDGEYVAVAE